jgi:ankyrin repeat protein
MNACAKSDISKIKTLIVKGADVNAIHSSVNREEGDPVLRFAIEVKNLEAVNLLLEAGADPNLDTFSPLIVSEVDTTSNTTRLSLLSHAIKAKVPLEIIRSLIQHGAFINSAEGTWTPLMVAAYRGYEDAVKLLLEFGANIEVKNCDGRTARDYAFEQWHESIEKLLDHAEYELKAKKLGYYLE